MRLTIFARLIISYLLLFSMLAGVSLYFIYHLDQFNQVTRSIILNDTSVVEISNQLSDVLLSETRYDRKYVVLKDEELYGNFMKASDEFTQLLQNALAKTSSQELKHILYAIHVQHQDFIRLVKEERERIGIAKPYSTELFATEKKKNADEILEKLKKIRQTKEKDVYAKILNLSEESDTARNVAILISVFAFSTGLIVAFIITSSIKRPLDIMKTKTVKIAQGDFSGDLDVSSPPLIADLAAAINTMCHKLQEVDDIKSDFFSHMSHELRTPLASIKEGTTMLLEGLGGEISQKQQRILSIVIQESNRMIELVNSLLDLSKIEAGMMNYQFARTDLAVLIRKSLDGLTPLADAKKISIENKIGSLPPVKVDRERMLQVFRNIIGNAIKFTPENGKVTLEAKIRESVVDYRTIIGAADGQNPETGTVQHETGNGEGIVEIAVQDTGKGIPEKDLGRIFLKFQQVTQIEGEKITGTGLGLATVNQIILDHGGKVWATSRVGKGSTFYIALPSTS